MRVVRSPNYKALANSYKWLPVPSGWSAPPQQAGSWGAAPDGWSYIFNQGILSMANDGSPYITDGSQMISLYVYLANEQPDPPPEYVTYEGLMVSYLGEPVTYDPV